MDNPVKTVGNGLNKPSDREPAALTASLARLAFETLVLDLSHPNPDVRRKAARTIIEVSR